jgi:hypothetical protein
VGARPAEAAAQGATQATDRAVDRVAEAIVTLRTELREERQFTELASIRSAQKQFLRANGKLPEFIDVGADVWFEVYDWHVRWQHPLAEGRDGQGRLTLAVNQTLVVLRPDVQGNHVGLPYDAR